MHQNRIRGLPILFTFWPGLPQLWLRGNWSGLFEAVAFAGFLNFVLFATYQQSDLLPKSGLIGCWLGLGAYWTLSIFRNDSLVKTFQRDSNSNTDSTDLDVLFEQGQTEYLSGNLMDAETVFERILWLNPHDSDARLYLATIHRHQGRLNQANRQLETLERESGAEKWHFQIGEERARIAEMEDENAESNLIGNGEQSSRTEPGLGTTEEESQIIDSEATSKKLSSSSNVVESRRFAA